MLLLKNSLSFDQRDLHSVILIALKTAKNTITLALEDDTDAGSNLADQQGQVRPLIRSKVLAESAMLLRITRFLRKADPQIASAFDDLAHLVNLHGRPPTLRVQLCRTPSSAFDHAATHIHLRSLGYYDQDTDVLLDEALKLHNQFGTERLPNHALDHQWLNNILSRSGRDWSPDPALLSQSCLAHQLDALGSKTAEFYAFTHVILYATDMGRLQPEWPRPKSELVSDAEAGLAFALDANNFDLAAELLWTWPMLAVAWTKAASFGLGILISFQKEYGFLPGPGYSDRVDGALEETESSHYRLRTSYHATFVMGFLCAAIINSNHIPPDFVKPERKSKHDMRLIIGLLDLQPKEPKWQLIFKKSDPCYREGLAEFLLTIALQRASDCCDLTFIRKCLEVAQHSHLTDGPAFKQAVALLQRVVLLAKAVPVPAA